MSTTLTNGLKLPDKGSVDWYADMQNNYAILDGAVGTVAEHTSALAGKAPLVHTHTKSDITDLFNSANTWSENNKFAKRADLAGITSVEDTTFAFTALNNTIFFNTRGSSNFKSYGTFLFAGYSNGSEPNRYAQIQLLRSTDKGGDTGNGYIPDSSFKMWRVAPHYLVMDFMEAVRVTNDGTENSLKPITNNTTDLGTSTSKWKTLNGVNPGALSLPSNSYTGAIAITEIDRTGWVYDGTVNTYSPPVDCWLSISNGGSITVWGSNTAFGMKATDNIAIPIRQGETYNISLTNTPDFCRIYPCTGNV